jgi:hypothetical protein
VDGLGCDCSCSSLFCRCLSSFSVGTECDLVIRSLIVEVYPKFTGLMRKTKNPLHKRNGYKKRRELSSTKIYIITAIDADSKRGSNLYFYSIYNNISKILVLN